MPDGTANWPTDGALTPGWGTRGGDGNLYYPRSADGDSTPSRNVQGAGMMAFNDAAAASHLVRIDDTKRLKTGFGTTAGSPTPARVAASTTQVVLLAANGNRLGVTITNDSPYTLYVRKGPGASATSYSVLMPAGAVLTWPDVGQALYTGIVYGIWSGASGAAEVEELV